MRRFWTLAFNPAATDTMDGSAQPAIGVPALVSDDASDGLAKRYYFVQLTEVRPCVTSSVCVPRGKVPRHARRSVPCDSPQP